jgi:hypothetical protein
MLKFVKKQFYLNTYIIQTERYDIMQCNEITSIIITSKIY